MVTDENVLSNQNQACDSTLMENSANTASTSNGVSVKVQAVFDAQTSRDKMSKLQTLLTRAQAYSKFLADRLQEQIAAPQPESKRRKGESQVENITGFAQPTLVTGGPLRGYQLEGVQWLVSLYENGLNGILADEMGLGKTVQCIAFLSFLREQGVLGPFLIVAPLSTLANWMSEWARWSPTVPALMYHGNQAEREAIRRKHLSPGGKQFSAVVTSYEVAMRDARYLSPLRWKYLIIDEGHRLKNFNCRLIRELKAYHSDNRLLITGTPLHNNLTELWSLLNFLLPEIFTDVDDFLSWFDIDLGEENDEAGEIECAEMISKLHLILKPLLLRRLKVEVEAQLPRKREYVLTSTLTTLQREYYQAVLEGRIRELISNDQEGRKKIRHSEHGDRPQPKGRGRQKISYTEPDDEIDSEQEYLISSSSSDHDDETPVKSPSAWSAAQGLQNKIMQLRKVCNHPYLFRYPTDPQDPANLCIDEALVESSGKMRLLDQLLNELLRRGHKVLIFSQMSRVLDILSDYLDLRGWSFSRIDGSVPQLQRQVEMQHFNEDPKCCIFLLSTRAGGLGINLVAADTVIFYDSDWNPQMDLQAQDRVHRIGQTKPVLIFRLSTVNTAEDRMLQRAASKRKLERLVIHKSTLRLGELILLERFKGRQQLLTDEKLLKEELEEILRGDDEQTRLDGQQGTELDKNELEMILDRSETALNRTDITAKSIRLVATG